jgi:hypothetical protein
MALTTPKDPAIPRYLRYKAEEKSSDDYWDEELERANSILHTRVLRVKRDKLCTGCARFDFLRTHFYTRECTPRDKRQAAGCQKVKNDAERPLIDQYERKLLGMRDDVDWHGFETIQEIEERVTLLAQHPEFEWRLRIDDELACTLCNMLLYTGKAAHLPLSLSPSKCLEIRLSAGILFEGGQHECREVRRHQRPKYVSQADQNTLGLGIFRFSGNEHNGSLYFSTSRRDTSEDSQSNHSTNC